MKKNIISKVELNGTFEISSPIVNPTFEITNSKAEYLFPTTLDLKINLDSGANAKIDIYSSDQVDPIFSQVFKGQWTQPYTYSYVLKYPGVQKIYLNASNSLNTIVTDKQEIFIEAPVTSLTASLFQSPVIYMMAGYGEASFKFVYENIATSGNLFLKLYLDA